MAQRHWNLIIYLLLSFQRVSSEQKFHSSARNYEWNLEKTSNSSDRVIQEVILHITPLCSLLHTLLKDKCMCLQDK